MDGCSVDRVAITNSRRQPFATQLKCIYRLIDTRVPNLVFLANSYKLRLYTILHLIFIFI